MSNDTALGINTRRWMKTSWLRCYAPLPHHRSSALAYGIVIDRIHSYFNSRNYPHAQRYILVAISVASFVWPHIFVLAAIISLQVRRACFNSVIIFPKSTSKHVSDPRAGHFCEAVPSDWNAVLNGHFVPCLSHLTEGSSIREVDIEPCIHLFLGSEIK